MSAVSVFVEFLVDAFQFLVNLVLDLICLAAYIASFVAVWRIPWLFTIPDHRSRNSLRTCALIRFACSLADFFIIPMGLITLVTWRSPYLIRAWWDNTEEIPDALDSGYYDVVVRVLAAKHFGLFLLDIPFLLLLVVVHLLPWRWFLFWREFYKSSNKPWYDTCCRKLIATHAANVPVDILCVVMAICIHLLTPWNIPLLWSENELSLRMSIGYWFLRGGADLALLLPFTLIHITFWRVPFLWRNLCKSKREQQPPPPSTDEEPPRNSCLKGYRLMMKENDKIVWKEFGLLIVDFGCFLLLVWVHVCTLWAPWRPMRFWKGMMKQRRLHPELPWWDVDYRERFRKDSVRGGLELFLIPFSLILGVTVYRIQPLRRDLKALDQQAKQTGNRKGIDLKKRIAFAKHTGSVFLDLPFGIPALIVMLTLWRAPTLVKKFKEFPRATARRWICLEQMVYLIRDIPFFILFICLIPTVYRFILALKALLSRVEDSADPTPVVTLESAIPTFENRRIVIAIRGTKPAHFTFTTARLYVKQDSFWDVLSDTMGGTVAFIGKSVLPIQLCPDVMDATKFPAGQETFEAELVFLHVSRRTVLSTLKKLRLAEVILGIEYGKHDGTLFNLQFTMQDLLQAEADGRSIPTTAPRLINPNTPTTTGSVNFAVYEELRDDDLEAALEASAAEAERVEKNRIEKEEAAEKTLTPLVQTTSVNEADEERMAIIPAAAATPTTPTAPIIRPRVPGENLVDIFWSVIGIHFLLIFYDLFALFFLILIHFIPWRAAKMWQSARESSEGGRLRRTVAAVESTLYWVRQRDIVMGRTMADVEAKAKEGSEGRPRGEFYEYLSCLRDAAVVLEEEEEDDLAERVKQAASWEEDLLEGHHRWVNRVCDSRRETVDGDAAQHRVEMIAVEENTCKLMKEWKTAVEGIQVERKVEWKQNGCCGPKVLCDLDRTRLAIYKAVALFAADCGAALCVLLVTATVYRAPTVLKSVWKARDWRRAAVLNVAQIPVDFLYLLKFCLTVLLLRYAFALPTDLCLYLPRAPSFHLARNIIDVYLYDSVKDICEMFVFCRVWKYYKFFVATLVWGIFAPAVLMDVGGEGYNKCCTVTLILSLCAAYYGYPVVFATSIAHKAAEVGINIFWGMMLILVLAGCGLSLRSSDTNDAARHFVPSWSLRLTWLNAITTYGWLLMEGIQLVALSSHIEHINQAVYVHLEGPLGFPVGFWVAFIITLCHYLLAALPVVLEDILEWKAEGTTSRWRPWVFLGEVTSSTLSVFVVANIATLLKCNQDGHLTVTPEVVCWEGNHATWSLVSMILLVFYIPTALLKDRKRSEASRRLLDIKWTEASSTVIRSAVLIWVVIIVMLGPDGDTRYYLGAAMGGVLTGVVAVWGALRWVCSVRVVVAYRALQFTWVALMHVVLLLHHKGWDDLYSGVAAIACTAVVGIAAVGSSYILKKQHATLQVNVDEIQHSMVTLEERLWDGHLMAAQWVARRSQWRRDVRSTTRPGRLAQHLVVLELNIRLVAYTPLLQGTRLNWASRCRTMATNDETQRDFHSYRDRSWDCPCCDCDSDSSDDGWNDRSMGPDVPLETLYAQLTDLIHSLTNGLTLGLPTHRDEESL